MQGTVVLGGHTWGLWDVYEAGNFGLLPLKQLHRCHRIQIQQWNNLFAASIRCKVLLYYDGIYEGMAEI